MNSASQSEAPKTVYCDVNEVAIETVPVPNYSQEEHGTWNLLLTKQLEKIDGNACVQFVDGVRNMAFPLQRIPELAKLSATLQSHTGWKLIRVDGLVHPKIFFGLLARKLFPATDFIRKRSELMYTPAPDMFHDLFGHTPLITNPDFTEFFEAFGNVGLNALKRRSAEDDIHTQLSRIYWFTVEFGLVDSPKGPLAYGSGTVSSPEELLFARSNKCKKRPFVVETVAAQNYDIWHIQDEVFVIDSFEQLGKDFRSWAGKNELL